MAEFTSSGAQTVASNQNVLFTDTPIKGNCSILHRVGSGLVTLRGLTQQSRALYKVYFSGNVSLLTGGTVTPISIAIAVNGEAVPSATMISSPGAVSLFNNVSDETFIEVPQGCCVQVGIKNLTSQSISVNNANIIVERVA